jgi:prepilin-type processing-associated H-X9-DG protein
VEHSWYSQIGPYIEQQAWYDMINFNVAWCDGGGLNLPARTAKLTVMECPSCGVQRIHRGQTAWDRWKGNYAVNFGNTNYGQITRSGKKYLGAPFSFVKSASFDEITDGLSNTLMMAEVIAPGEVSDSSTWDGPIAEMEIAEGGQTFEGWLTPNSSSSDEVAYYCPEDGNLNGISGCTVVGGDEAYPYQTFAARSHHPGGVNASLCDGSVNFFLDSIDTTVWRALSTSRGDEVIQGNAY